MLEIGRRGVGFRNFYNKERLKNAKWFVRVCKPELQRLTESIVKLKRKCQKIVRRIKDLSAEMEELEDLLEVIHFQTTFDYSKHF
jgi:hypothetical protein